MNMWVNMWDKVFELCKQEIEARRQEEAGVFVVTIDGMCGSGKTTLGSRLQEYFGCSLFHMDDFFLQAHQRTPERLAEAGGNVDYERFQEEVLNHLQDREGLFYQKFDCSSFALGEAVHVPWCSLVIIEGAYCCHPYFGEYQNLRFFLESSRESQLERILARSGPQKLERFREIWIPMEERYFEAYDIPAKCVRICVD